MSCKGLEDDFIARLSVLRAKNWVDQIALLMPLGINPEPKQIEDIGNLIDLLHDFGFSIVAHKLDESMCAWCELLLDA